MKILIIIPYFGKCPEWMDYLLQTCAYNSSIHWLFYSDLNEPADCPENIRFERKTMDDFNILASQKLDLSISISHPYKICDLRPAFGHIFSDYLEVYDIWGYADLDLIFGNISTFLSEDLLVNHDVISVREGYLTGHFALYKNTKIINGLYTKSSMYRQIFQDAHHHYAFDERSNIFGKRLHDRYRIFTDWWISQQIKSLIMKIRFRINPAIKKIGFPDMSSITQSLSDSGEIKLYQHDLVRSDLWYDKHKISQWEIAWEGGTVRDVKTGEEFLHFHFIKSKGKKRFHIASCMPGTEFRISPSGIMPVLDQG
jgi:hypothetical protein